MLNKPFLYGILHLLLQTSNKHPDYLLSEVGYYYLNDFGSLTDALPKVRPTIFFSVPRFYEKLWDQVTANKVGKMWLAEKPGAKKQAMGALLRTVVLRKAGIDQCRQLIVGSLR